MRFTAYFLQLSELRAGCCNHHVETRGRFTKNGFVKLVLNDTPVSHWDRELWEKVGGVLVILQDLADNAQADYELIVQDDLLLARKLGSGSEWTEVGKFYPQFAHLHTGVSIPSSTHQELVATR